MLDTKLTNCVVLRPQTDCQTKVVNKMIMHILHMYNSKHRCTLDEIMPYVQYSYNGSLSSSIDHSPFNVGLGFQPLCPIDVAISFVATKVDSTHVQAKDDNTNKFLSAFMTSASRSMTYQIDPMLSAGNIMMNIQCHRPSRCLEKFSYICKRSSFLGPTKSFAYFDMGLTPSLRLWHTTLLTLAFPCYLVCTQCSMWTTFFHTFH